MRIGQKLYTVDSYGRLSTYSITDINENQSFYLVVRKDGYQTVYCKHNACTSKSAAYGWYFEEKQDQLKKLQEETEKCLQEIKRVKRILR